MERAHRKMVTPIHLICILGEKERSHIVHANKTDSTHDATPSHVASNSHYFGKTPIHQMSWTTSRSVSSCFDSQVISDSQYSGRPTRNYEQFCWSSDIATSLSSSPCLRISKRSTFQLNSLFQTSMFRQCAIVTMLIVFVGRESIIVHY